MKAVRAGFAMLLVMGLIFSHGVSVFAQESDMEQEESVITQESAPTVSEEQPQLEKDSEPEPEPEEYPNVVYDEEQLAAWCVEHKNTGGTVYLGDSIEIKKGIDIGGTITIDTQSYGLIYNGSTVSGFGLITGEGVKNPVIEIINTGVHYMGGNQNNDIIDSNITAYGQDGIGGTAVRLSEINGKFSFGYFNDYQGLIQSFGIGAVGLELPMQADVYCLDISVEGENSMAVYAQMGANMFYCKLKASGSGATAAAGGQILLDTCAAEPSTGDFTAVQRYISPASSRLFYISAIQNAEYVDLFTVTQFSLMLEGGDEPVWQNVMIMWDGAPDGSIYPDVVDTSVVGRTTVYGKLMAPLRGLGLENHCPLELVVGVRDPASPCIGSLYIEKMWGGNGFMAVFSFWDSYDPADDSLCLWRSDDNGASWYDNKDSPDIEWYGDTMVFYFSELASPVQFQLEIIGVGESNVATINMDGGQATGDAGGDRTGADRIIGKKPGSDDETPPTNEGDPDDDETPPTNEDDPNDNDDNTSPDGEENTNTGNENTNGNDDNGNSGGNPTDISESNPPDNTWKNSDSQENDNIGAVQNVIPVAAVDTGTHIANLDAKPETDAPAEVKAEISDVPGNTQLDSVVIEDTPVPMGSLDAPVAKEPLIVAVQPSLPDSPSYPGTVMTVSACAALLLVGAALWIKRVKLRG